jgi:hypothetical protein
LTDVTATGDISGGDLDTTIDADGAGDQTTARSARGGISGRGRGGTRFVDGHARASMLNFSGARTTTRGGSGAASRYGRSFDNAAERNINGPSRHPKPHTTGGIGEKEDIASVTMDWSNEVKGWTDGGEWTNVTFNLFDCINPILRRILYSKRQQKQ